MTRYVGNGPYCYANATSMLLTSIGEHVHPPRIEALTGVGLGAFYLPSEKLIFFGNLGTPPDVGVSKALELLGFEHKETAREEGEPAPFEELRADLAKSPAVLGPLDMGYLTHNPSHAYLAGADHFVLAYGICEREIYLHDPEGFPHVSLPLHQLELAWKAESIPYRRGSYRYWTSPRRVVDPTEEEIYDRALPFFKSCYEDGSETPGNRITGRDGILQFAGHVRGGNLSRGEVDHLVYFALKLGSRRALDFAFFFDFRDQKLAALKRRQAELFGRCHTLAVANNWPSLADALLKLADVEEGFRVTLLAT